MIFVCTGTQVYQMDRLIRKLDDLVASGAIQDDMFAQIGNGTYLPQHFAYRHFVSADEFAALRSKADIIISHGGTGALIGALKEGKNVVAVPRYARFGEHTDDHQLQIVTMLEREGYLYAVYDIDTLGDVLEKARTQPCGKPYQRESNVLPILRSFLQSL